MRKECFSLKTGWGARYMRSALINLSRNCRAPERLGFLDGPPAPRPTQSKSKTRSNSASRPLTAAHRRTSTVTCALKRRGRVCTCMVLFAGGLGRQPAPACALPSSLHGRRRRPITRHQRERCNSSACVHVTSRGADVLGGRITCTCTLHCDAPLAPSQAELEAHERGLHTETATEVHNSCCQGWRQERWTVGLCGKTRRWYPGFVAVMILCRDIVAVYHDCHAC